MQHELKIDCPPGLLLSLPTVSRPLAHGRLSWPLVCHPWTLDSGIHDRNDGVFLFSGTCV